MPGEDHISRYFFTCSFPFLCYPVSTDSPLLVDAVFLDLSKVFDKVSYVLLMQKLCNFGACACLLNWCRDYLSNREQRVVIDLFSLYILFSHFRPRDATRGNSSFQMSSYARANLRITNEKTKGKFP